VTPPVDGPAGWLLLAAAALLVGVAKTSLGGLAAISVALCALVLPARESTAALLMVLLVGDAIAVLRYHRHCDWRLLGQLVPGVLPGLVLGSALLAVIDDATLRRGIGLVLVALVALQLLSRRRAAADGAAARPWGLPARSAAGIAAGFTTMVANAAGAVMTLYLTAQRVDKHRFLGTSAWFFLMVNLTKVPFSVGLGLVSVPMLTTTVLLVPLVLLGGLVGIWLIGRLRQRGFESAVLTASALSAGALLI
jgi:uncharacterized membrane protein YfcA